MFSKHSLTPTKASSGPLLYKITPSKVASHSQSNASVSEGLRMLDLSQFKRSEEEVRAQIEAKQAPMSEIIEEKVEKKVKFMPTTETTFEKKARNRIPFPELQVGTWRKLTPRI